MIGIGGFGPVSYGDLTGTPRSYGLKAKHLRGSSYDDSTGRVVSVTGWPGSYL